MSRLVFSQGSCWASDSGLGVLQAPKGARLRASANVVDVRVFIVIALQNLLVDFLILPQLPLSVRKGIGNQRISRRRHHEMMPTSHDEQIFLSVLLIHHRRRL